ncbi:hypothetical protein ACP70R_031354 [Stipagrostis hirtigluma subsp. patula]
MVDASGLPEHAVADGEDRIIQLDDALLSNIVARLPINDAVRAAAVSGRWRRVLASAPLALNDADLLPDRPDDDRDRGPQRRRPPPRRRLLRPGRAPGPLQRRPPHRQLRPRGEPRRRRGPAPLAPRPRREGRRRPRAPQPELDRRRPPRRTPRLRQVGLRYTDIAGVDLDRLLQYSPMLEKLALVGSENAPRVLVRSLSLRCALFWMSVTHRLHVILAPRLERLILCSTGLGDDGRARLGDDFHARVDIADAPRLEVLGYLDPRIHELELAHDTVIQVETKLTPATMVPSVKVLALKVRLGVPKEAMMVAAFLRCFPNVETLHVMSDEDDDEPTGTVDLTFWQEAAPIRALQWATRKIVIKNFRGNHSELAFLWFVWERARVLRELVVDLAGGGHALMEEMVARVKSQLDSAASTCRKSTRVTARAGGPSAWRFSRAANLSLADPF